MKPRTEDVAGNLGPAPATSESPANNPGTVAAGAVDASLGVAGFSSRGPGACDGRTYPNACVAAQGKPAINVVSIRSEKGWL